MKVKKYRLKKSVKKILIISVAALAILIISIVGIKRMIYQKGNTYKLLEVGYKEDEVKTINKELSNKQIEKLINADYNDYVVKIIKSKYYIEDYYDRYLAYHALNTDLSAKDLIALVNVGADHEWYDEKYIKNADLSKKELILVNKFHKLGNNYKPENLKTITLMYAYNDNNMESVAADAFIKMASDAKKEGLTLIASSSYRSYDKQEKLYNGYVLNNGEIYANEVSAKAGHSEHQTGYATDVFTYNTSMSEFKDTAESEWLQNNSYKYGYILRYPEDKTHITGYAYESWHYRYVGIDAATKMFNEKITFDEYYAYYIENK